MMMTFVTLVPEEFKGVSTTPEKHAEELNFEYVKLSQRSYK